MRLLPSFLAAAVLLTYGGRPADAATGRDSIKSQLQKILDAHLRERGKLEHFSCLSLSVSFAGDPNNLNVVAGRMSLEPDAPPITPQTLFQIGSNTKAFTAAAILQLEADRKLTLDETLGDRLPEYPAWRSVTIRRLLNMTSGIPEYFDGADLLRVEAHNIHRRWTAPQLIAWVDPVYGHAPPPVTGWSYSNTGYLLAQLLIERVTGQSYAAEIADRFLGSRYGLESTFYSPNVYPQTVLERTASGYFWQSHTPGASMRSLLGADVKTSDMSYAQAAGGMVSTPEDLTRWVRSLYQGQVLEPKQRAELTAVVSMRTGLPIAQTAAGAGGGFGLGVGQQTSPELGTFWYYQGETLGYRMLYFYFPAKDLVFAFGINSAPDDDRNDISGLVRAIYNAVTKES